MREKTQRKLCPSLIHFGQESTSFNYRNDRTAVVMVVATNIIIVVISSIGIGTTTIIIVSIVVVIFILFKYLCFSTLVHPKTQKQLFPTLSRSAFLN